MFKITTENISGGMAPAVESQLGGLVWSSWIFRDNVNFSWFSELGTAFHLIYFMLDGNIF